MEWPTKDDLTKVLVENIVGQGKRFSDLSDSWFTKHLIIALREGIWLFLLVARGVYDNLSVRTSSGQDLDDKGYDFGVDRKPKTKAQHLVTLHKSTAVTEDYPVPDNFLVTTTSIANQPPVKFVVAAGQNKKIAAGEKSVDDVIVECMEFGEVGNVGQGLINLVAQAGFDSVSNSRLYAVGVADESDDDYRQRILEKKRKPAKAGVPRDWENWALEVAGVSSAVCFRTPRGPGTVDIMILGPDGELPGEGLIAECQAHLDELTPADIADGGVKVVAPELVPIAIILKNVRFKKGYDQENSQDILKNALEKYFVKARNEIKVVDIIVALRTAADPSDSSNEPIVVDFIVKQPNSNIVIGNMQMAQLERLAIEV